jgi:hypothetical protein
VETYVSLAPRDEVRLTLEKRGDEMTPHEQRGNLPHTTCDDMTQYMDMLGAVPK